MSKTAAFLSQAEFVYFQQPGRFISRTVVPAQGERQDVTSFGGASRRSRFNVTVVQVAEDDGASWSAEAVVQATRDAHPQFECRGLRDAEEDVLPSLTTLIPRTRFLKLAAKCRLTDRFLSPTVARGLWLLPLVTTAVVESLKGFKLSAPVIAFGAVISGLLVAGRAPLTEFLAGRRIRSSEDKLKARLRDTNRSGHHWRDLVGELVAELRRGPFPRHVIIHDFEALDLLTRDVVSRYFEESLEIESPGREAWCVFEGPGGQNFSNTCAFTIRRLIERKTLSQARQLPLSEAEKRRLVKQINGADAQLAFTTVKSVCDSTMTAATLRLKPLRELVSVNSERSSDIMSLLGLLSAAGLGSSYRVQRSQLVNQLSVKGGPRALLLAEILPGTTLNKDEFRDRLSELATSRECSRIIEFSSDGTTITISPEGALALVRDAAALGLNKIGLCHIYWASARLDDLRGHAARHALRSADLRQLIAGLREIDIKQVQAAQGAGGAAIVFDALLFAIEWGLRVCLLSDIVRMLQLVAGLLEYDGLVTDRTSKAARAFKTAWQAFTLLGDDQILAIIARLTSLSDLDSPIEAPPAADSGLLELFAQSVPHSAHARWFQRQLVAAEGPGPIRSISLYCTARATWLALSLLPLRPLLPGTSLSDAINEALRDMDRMMAAAFASAEEQDKPSLIDAVTLCVLMWCTALQANDEPWGSEPAEMSPGRLKVVGLAEQLVTLAGRLQPPEDLSVEDFPLSAISHDLATTALCAVASVCPRRAGISQSEETVLRIARIVSRVRSDLGLPKKDIIVSAPYDALVEEAQALCALSVLTWERLGIEYLQEFASLRRLQLHARISPVTADTFEEFVGLAQSLRGFDRQTFLGVLENLTMASCLERIGDFAVRHVVQAAQLSIAESFGRHLCEDLCFLAIRMHPGRSSSTDTCLRTLLDSVDNALPLHRLLQRVPDDRLTGAMADLSMASTGSSLRPTVMRALSELVPAIDSFEARREADAFLAYTEIIERIEQVEPQEFLSSWNDRRDLSFYAAVLAKLLPHHAGNKLLIDAAKDCLRDRDPETDGWSGWFELSVALGERLRAGEPGGKAIVDYVRRGIDLWSQRRTAAGNVDAFALLAKLDPHRRDEYKEQGERWKVIRVERDHFEMLPTLARTERFFSLFDAYCGIGTYWGLNQLIGNTVLHDLSPEMTDIRRLERWMGTGNHIPDPLLPERAAVSADFLVLGRILFSLPPSEFAAEETLRTQFDRRAQQSVSDLLDIILALPRLPVGVRRLLRDFSVKTSSEAESSAA